MCDAGKYRNTCGSRTHGHTRSISARPTVDWMDALRRCEIYRCISALEVSRASRVAEASRVAISRFTGRREALQGRTIRLAGMAPETAPETALVWLQLFARMERKKCLAVETRRKIFGEPIKTAMREEVPPDRASESRCEFTSEKSGECFHVRKNLDLRWNLNLISSFVAR